MLDFRSEIKWMQHVLSNISVKKVVACLRLNKPPIIIGGCGRSGTSILLSVISAHPGIYGISEETNIYGYPRKFKSKHLSHINNIRKIFPYLLEDKKILTSSRWCEKTPRNVRFIEEINREFNGKVNFIHIIRDGRDVITSRHPLSGEYHVPIERWVNDVSLGIKYRDSFNLFEVKYESLVLKYKETMESLLLFLGESYSEQMEDFRTHTNVKNHPAFETRNVDKIYSKSIGKWKGAEHALKISEFYNNHEAVSLLLKLGYEI